MKKLIALAFAVACSPAVAEEPSKEISDKALTCLREPSGAPIEYAMSFDVQISEGGKVADITVDEYKPKTTEGEIMAAALSRAIERCQPYSDIKSGTSKVVFSQGKKFIDPFKKGATK